MELVLLEETQRACSLPHLVCTKRQSHQLTARWWLPTSQQKRSQNKTYLAITLILVTLTASRTVRSKNLLLKPPHPPAVVFCYGSLSFAAIGKKQLRAQSLVRVPPRYIQVHLPLRQHVQSISKNQRWKQRLGSFLVPSLTLDG